jgi:hypothetical protein
MVRWFRQQARAGAGNFLRADSLGGVRTGPRQSASTPLPTAGRNKCSDPFLNLARAYSRLLA